MPKEYSTTPVGTARVPYDRNARGGVLRRFVQTAKDSAQYVYQTLVKPAPPSLVTPREVPHISLPPSPLSEMFHFPQSPRRQQPPAVSPRNLVPATLHTTSPISQISQAPPQTVVYNFYYQAPPGGVMSPTPQLLSNVYGDLLGATPDRSRPRLSGRPQLSANRRPLLEYSGGKRPRESQSGDVMDGSTPHREAPSRKSAVPLPPRQSILLESPTTPADRGFGFGSGNTTVGAKSLATESGSNKQTAENLSGMGSRRPTEEQSYTALGGALDSGRPNVLPAEKAFSFMNPAPVDNPSEKGFGFGNNGAEKTDKPFSFGGDNKPRVDNKPEESHTINNDKRFGFGGEKSGDQYADKPIEKAPGFTFGGAEKPVEKAGQFSFGGDKAGEKETAFSFAGSAEKPAEKANFSFGATAEKPAEKANFSFGASAEKPAEKAAFSFGASAEKPGEKANFSFGASAEKPAEKAAFSFGGDKAAEKASAFSFGGSADKPMAPPAPAAPTTGFGSFVKAGPCAVEFEDDGFAENANSDEDAEEGTPSTTAAPVKETTTSTFKANDFSFKPPEKGAGGAPAFSFGGDVPPAPKSGAPLSFSGGPDKGTPIPAFNFGTPVEKSSQPFSFSGTPDKSEKSGPLMAQPKAATPAFSFSGTAEKAPAFGFGTNTEKSTAPVEKAPAPAFTFGAPSADKPFSFGGESDKNKTNPTPAFSFGAPSQETGKSPFGESTALVAKNPNPPSPFTLSQPSPFGPPSDSGPAFTFGGGGDDSHRKKFKRRAPPS